MNHVVLEGEVSGLLRTGRFTGRLIVTTPYEEGDSDCHDVEFREEHGSNIRDGDWVRVEGRLRYGVFRSAVVTPDRPIKRIDPVANP